MRKSRNMLASGTGARSGARHRIGRPGSDGCTDNRSEVNAGISPNFQSSTNAGPATLFSQVQTFDADGAPNTVVQQAAERVTVEFDDDMTILPGSSASKFPTCGGQDWATTWTP